MKKHLVTGALAATFIVSACSNENSQEEANDTQQTPEREEEHEVESNAGEDTVNGVHQTVHDTVIHGHSTMSKYNELHGWEDEDAAAKLETIMEETLIPRTEEALENAEDDALKQDLERIHRVSTQFHETMENNTLEETEWRSRTSELRNAFGDLDYYIRGIDDFEPKNVTQYATKQLDKAMQEELVQEQFTKLPEDIQKIVETPRWNKEAFINDKDFRIAVVEAYEEKGDLQREDFDFLREKMVEENATKDETVQAFKEERL